MDSSYPDAPIISKEYPLMSIRQTEEYMEKQLKRIVQYENADEDVIPSCTDEELWRNDSIWKYYKNPANLNKPNGRSTKNFDSLVEANIRLQEDGNVGIVVEKKGEVRRCNYCPGYTICKQKDSYIADGLLTVLE
jgi:hypothetical protein